tara:strand:+ start:1197 stop:1406 length:210 start_codon:yes stop_codon:yes gene_type:complete
MRSKKLAKETPAAFFRLRLALLFHFIHARPRFRGAVVGRDLLGHSSVFVSLSSRAGLVSLSHRLIAATF